MIIRDEDIGGAIVKRGFNRGTKAGPLEFLHPGHALSREEVLAIPHLNRQALIDGDKITIYPPPPSFLPRHAVSVGFGHWMVFEGNIVGTKLTKEEAAALAAEGPVGGDVEDAPPIN